MCLFGDGGPKSPQNPPIPGDRVRHLNNRMVENKVTAFIPSGVRFSSQRGTVEILMDNKSKFKSKPRPGVMGDLVASAAVMSRSVGTISGNQLFHSRCKDSR